jgi:hypothetical protein
MNMGGTGGGTIVNNGYIYFASQYGSGNQNGYWSNFSLYSALTNNAATFSTIMGSGTVVNMYSPNATMTSGSITDGGIVWQNNSSLTLAGSITSSWGPTQDVINRVGGLLTTSATTNLYGNLVMTGGLITTASSSTPLILNGPNNQFTINGNAVMASISSALSPSINGTVTIAAGATLSINSSTTGAWTYLTTMLGR